MAAAMPSTPGEWLAFVGTGFLEGLVSPFTWLALLLGVVVAWLAEWADNSVRPPRRDTRVVWVGWLDRLGSRRATAGREEQ